MRLLSLKASRSALSHVVSNLGDPEHLGKFESDHWWLYPMETVIDMQLHYVNCAYRQRSREWCCMSLRVPISLKLALSPPLAA
jgi:hypothetical protein